MKKSLALTLVLSLLLTMFMSVPAMAEETSVIVSTFAALKTAVQSGAADVIILSETPNIFTYANSSSDDYGIVVTRPVTIKSQNPANPNVLKSGTGYQLGTKHFTINAGGDLTLENVIVRGNGISGASTPANTQGGIRVNTGGTLTFKNSTLENVWENMGRYGYGYGAIGVNGGTATVIDSVIKNNRADNGGAISVLNSGKLTVVSSEISGNYMSMLIQGFQMGSGILADPTAEVKFKGNVVLNNPYDYTGTGMPADGIRWNMTEDIKDEQRIPETHAGGADSASGKTGIEFTIDPPILISPEDPYLPIIFKDANIYGSDFWFGTHLVSSEAKTFPSMDNDDGYGEFISLATYNSHKLNGTYSIKGSIGTFKRSDGVVAIDDFTLGVIKNSAAWVDGATPGAYNVTDPFEIDPGEEPVKLFDTNTVGYMLSDYSGELKLPADAVKAVGLATAVMTWTIEVEV